MDPRLIPFTMDMHITRWKVLYFEWFNNVLVTTDVIVYPPTTGGAGFCSWQGVHPLTGASMS